MWLAFSQSEDIVLYILSNDCWKEVSNSTMTMEQASKLSYTVTRVRSS